MRKIRYEIKIGDTARMVDDMPTESEIEDMVYLCQNRGYDFTLTRKETTLHEHLAWGQGRLEFKDTVLHEYLDR